MRINRLFFLFLYLVPVSFTAISQKKNKEDNGRRDALLVSSRTFDQEILDSLKTSKTVFFYGRETGLTLDSLKAAVRSAWDLTPLIFENIDKIWDYIGEKGYSCFVIEGVRTGADFINKQGFSRSVTNVHLYLTLRNYIGPGLCRVELYPDPETTLSNDYDHFKYEVAYKKGHFYNWSPVYLKAQIQAVATDLKKGIRPDLIEEFTAANLPPLLQTDTLYISSSLLGKYQPLAGKEKGDKEDLFKTLKSPYRVCSDSELYNIFITEDRGRFLFEYVKSSTHKFIKIYDLKNKEIVYKGFDNGYNLNSNDLKKFSK